MHTIDIENLKCGGCANSIQKNLLQLAEVQSVEVDVERAQVQVDCTATALDEVKSVLQSLGYPERGSVQGLESVSSKAKSFVSCAVGRIQK
jgi:copper chaperone